MCFISFWLIYEIAFMLFGKPISCFKMTFFNSWMFFALNGGLCNKICTFRTTSSSSRLPVNRYLLCCYTPDVVELREPYSEVNPTLLQQDPIHLGSSRNRNLQSSHNLRVREYLLISDLYAGSCVYTNAGNHGLTDTWSKWPHLLSNTFFSLRMHQDRLHCRTP